MSNQDNVQKERELIAKIQKNNDMFAMKELLRMYRGAIRTCVRGAQLHTVMSEDDAIAYAENIVRHSIKENFDLSQKNKPSTFIIDSLKKKLMTLRYQHMNQHSRLSTDLTMKAGYVAKAIPMLKRRGIEDPTEEQIVNFVKKEFGKSQRFTKAEAKRIAALSRTELAADTAISKDVAGASQMSLGETLNTQQISPQDLLKQKFLQDKIERVINSPGYTRNERTFIRMVYRIGKYKTAAVPNIHQAALNCGLADSSARRLLSRLEQELGSV